MRALLGRLGHGAAALPGARLPGSAAYLGQSAVINTTAQAGLTGSTRAIHHLIPFAGKLVCLYSNWGSGPSNRHVVLIDQVSGAETDLGIVANTQGWDSWVLTADGRVILPCADADTTTKLATITNDLVATGNSHASLFYANDHLLDIIEWGGKLYMAVSDYNGPAYNLPGFGMAKDSPAVYSSTDGGATWTTEWRQDWPDAGGQIRATFFVPNGQYLYVLATGWTTNHVAARSTGNGSWAREDSIDFLGGYSWSGYPNSRHVLADGSVIYLNDYLWQRNRDTSAPALLRFVPGQSAAVEVMPGSYLPGSGRVRAIWASNGFVWAAVRSDTRHYDELWRAAESDLSNWTLTSERLPWDTTSLCVSNGTLFLAAGNSTPIWRIYTGADLTGADYNPATDKRGVAATAGGTGLSVTLTKDAGVIEGDLLVAVIARNNRGQAIQVPAGWTMVNGAIFSTTCEMRVYVKIAGASEPGSYQWSHGSPSASWAGVLQAFAGPYEAATLVEVSATLGDATNLYTSPILTLGPWAKRLLVCALGIEGARTVTPPSGYTVDGQVIGGTMTAMLATCDTALGAGDTRSADFTLDAATPAQFVAVSLRRGGTGPANPPAEALADAGGDLYVHAGLGYVLRQ